MSEFMDDAPVGMLVSPLTIKVPFVSASSVHSTPPLTLANKAKRLDMIVSNLFKMKNNGSAAVRIESTRTATTASAETGAIERSIRESGSEDRDDMCNNDDADKNDEGQFACLDCSSVFGTDAAFKQHIVSHEGYRRFKCTVCEKRFITKQHRMLHMRTHTGERPFGCNVCEKKFTIRGHLTVHKRIHTGERLYKCDTCEKKFTNSSHLVEHTRIHTGEKPFVCDICKKCFSQSGSLIVHKRIHMGERPFVCPTCQKRFSRSGDLYRHALCHTGEKPLQCEMGFTRPVYLKMHQRFLTAEKSSKCDICNKGYVHCLTCGECFNSNCDYHIHKRMQHEDPDAGSQSDLSHFQHLPCSSQFDARRESSPMEEIIITD